MKEFIINGVAESGKDTFVSFVTNEMFKKNIKVFNYSSIDPFRTMPKQFGWESEKDNNYRKCLYYLKKASTYINDYPNKYLFSLRETHKNTDVVVFYHIREPEEIDKFISYYKEDIPPTAILVTRNNISIPNNYADNDVNNFDYDCIVENNGTLDDLKDAAKTFVDNYILGVVW
jgi:hypothetical protein